MRLLLATALRGRVGRLVGAFGLVCGSWVQISRPTTGRSYWTPLGSSHSPSARLGNLLASRTMFFFLHGHVHACELRTCICMHASRHMCMCRYFCVCIYIYIYMNCGCVCVCLKYVHTDACRQPLPKIDTPPQNPMLSGVCM